MGNGSLRRYRRLVMRATFDLLLPKSLGFKVTPKGIVSERRRFDVSSSRLTLAAAAIAAVALSAFELVAFGIEVEAYAFNPFWAGANLAAILAALVAAWERRSARGRASGPPRRCGWRGRTSRSLPRRWTSRPPAPALASPRAPPATVELLAADAEPRVLARVTWRRRCGQAPAPDRLRGRAGRGAPRARAHRVLVGEALVGAHDARTREPCRRHGASPPRGDRSRVPAPPDTPAPRSTPGSPARLRVGARGRARRRARPFGWPRRALPRPPARRGAPDRRATGSAGRGPHTRRVVPVCGARASPTCPNRSRPVRRMATLPPRQALLSSHPRRDTQMRPLTAPGLGGAAP